MAIILKESVVTVSTSGTAVALTGGSPSIPTKNQKTPGVIITAGESNSGIGYVGSSAVVASTGLGQSISAGESLTLAPPQQFGNDEVLDLTKIYIDSTVNGDVFTVSFYVRED